MLAKVILFFFLGSFVWSQETSTPSETPTDTPFTAESQTPFETKKSKEINPDVHLLGMPLKSSEEKTIEVYGKPQARIQFNDKLSGLLYQWDWVFFYNLDQLCGVCFANGALDYRLLDFVKNFSYEGADQKARWRLSNGISNLMTKADVKKILKKNTNEQIDDYQAFYQTAKCYVLIDFSGSSHSTKKDDTAFEVKGIIVMEKGPYEEYKLRQ